MAPERLQKLLAAAGHGSRRACEAYIEAGRVRVNGQTAHLGDKADPAVDKITFDGMPLHIEAHVYILLYKPRGVVSSLEAQGERSTVRDLVPVGGRLYPVGRLDAQSEGLVLLTNDGELTNRLTHPRYGHEKEYRVLLRGRIDESRLEAWRRGVVIRDEEGNSERTAPAIVESSGRDRESGGMWLRVIMHEGKKHQIRRVAETLGLDVSRLIRVRLGPLHLDRVKPGEWRYLTRAEERKLLDEAGLEAEKPPQRAQAAKRPRHSGGPAERKGPAPKRGPRSAPAPKRGQQSGPPRKPGSPKPGPRRGTPNKRGPGGRGGRAR